MSIFKGLIETLNTVLNSYSQSSPSTQTYKYSSDRTASEMDAVDTGNERIAFKIKGFLDIAEGEVQKGVNAEEWGLAEVAISHYRSAQKILAEAMSTPVPSYATPRELEKVRSHRQKISRRQGEVLERLQTLNRRTGRTSMAENTASRLRSNVDTPSTSNSRRATQQNPPSRISSGTAAVNRTNNAVSPRSSQQGGSSYEASLVEMINTLILDRIPSVKWEDIAGLEKAKQALSEMVILPTKRRDLFTGLRKPAKGLLLFGPPGTGKTMLARAVASESQATFFNVSASSLTSKWVGEGEKLVRALFTVAISRQPSVIFIDEIDSIMSMRMSNENEASRRLKSEFLVQFDGVASSSNDLVIVIGATNRPQELDDAVLRRLVKRIYIPLPDASVRKQLLSKKLNYEASLTDGELERLVNMTDGYSGSDLEALCNEAGMMPIRELGSKAETVNLNQVRKVRYEDLQKAMAVIRPSLQKNKWLELEQWNQEFGAN